MSVASAVPVVSPGFRLVPALIGLPGSAVHVWVPCPVWCHIDHSKDRQVAVEDVWHGGDYVDLELPHRGGKELLAYFRLGSDPYSSDESKRGTFVFAEDGMTANGHYMDPEHVEEFCERTIASLERLRALARSVAG
ncbi:hypothetical protein [Streptomyces sp. SID10815]|uniref:DUF6907 domain-containing protein n=1 Tax=Streptomyces sp. SID10815 TaxID=2706027 RepID=UPI0013CBB564|nr:hypothetical protein [Streptomyces sp. SID10815]NEA52383.1 hypothetical protein [Streptomyces sp. SID10815]